jgi:hypothetical protein
MMRRAIVDIVYNKLSSFWEKDAFRELVREGGDFALDLVGKFANN